MNIVLDTNIWLDKLIFNDINVQTLFQKIQNKEIIPLANSQMFEELKRVLQYPQFMRFNHDIPKCLEYYQKYINLQDIELNTFPHKCKDKDDQVFLDFCYTLKIENLISKDNHLLKMKKTLKKYNIVVNLPQNFV